MSDVVVTVPMRLWDDWIAEGDAAGDPPTGVEWGFWTNKARPKIDPGERVYIVAHGKLRGYAPLTRVVVDFDGRVVLCREGAAIAVTIRDSVSGFRGWRYRWWDRSLEVPFPEWRTPYPAMSFADERFAEKLYRASALRDPGRGICGIPDDGDCAGDQLPALRDGDVFAAAVEGVEEEE